MFTATDIPPAIQHSLQQHFPDQKLLGFEPTFGGFSNWTQLVLLEEQQLIVKAASEPHKRIDLRREATALHYLSNTDMPIAPIYALDDYESWTVLLLGYLPGINGLKLLEQEPETIIGLYHQLGATLAKLHRLPLPQQTLLAEPIAQRARAAFIDCEQTIPHAIRWPLIDGLRALAELPAIHLIHGDPGAHNLLWDGKLSGLLDWEWAGVGHALIDLAWLKWTLRFRRLDSQVWEAFCTGYGHVPAADSRLMQRLALGQMAAIIARLNEQPIARAEWLRRVEWTIAKPNYV